MTPQFSETPSTARLAARNVKKLAYNGTFKILEASIFRSSRIRLFIIFGMKRSGNHLFINWLLSQYPGPAVFYNHVRPNQIPYRRWKREWRFNNPTRPPAIIFSYEDRDFEEVFQGPLRDFLKEYESRIVDTKICIVMRDPKNFFASRFKKWPEEHNELDRVRHLIAKYCDYALAYQGGGALACFGDATPVSYNDLISSELYRRELAALLDVRDGMRGLDEVPRYGHGSSFDGVALHGRAEEMDVFGRWRGFADDPVFREVMADAEIAKINHALFAAGPPDVSLRDA